MGKQISFKVFDSKSYNEQIINSVIELQSRIIQGLDNKTFILEKSKDDYEKFIQKENGIMVCAFNDDNELIGSLTTKSSEHNTFNINVDDGYNDKLECANCMVDPNYRKHGILKQLLKQVAQYYENKKTLLTAEVVVNNYASLFSFLKSGFVIDNAEICEFDKAKLLYLFYVGKDKLNTIIKDNNDVKQEENRLVIEKSSKIKTDGEIENDFSLYTHIIKEKKRSIILDENESNTNQNVLLYCNLSDSLKDFDNVFGNIALKK